MNHVSIFEKKWLDLVFEGKNKSYGAYQLRLENSRTTLTALFFGLLLMMSVVGIGVATAKLGKQQIGPLALPLEEPVIPVNLSQPPKQPETKATPPVVNPEKPQPNTQQLANPVIVPTSQAPNVTLTNNPVPPDVPPGAGIPGENPTPGSPANPGNPSTGTAPAGPSGPVPMAILDKMPEYPGGIKNFYKYVGDNFDKPDIDDVKTVTVIVMFVIEKDGSITDVRIARDPGYGMAKEAVRVLKSMKTKWTPGYKNNEPVRTAYTLPITVNIN
jgi:periplasmic protein TonB